MIHMRPFNAFEDSNAKFLVSKQVDFATIEATETGLKKSILDATAPVRAFLKEKGVHNYMEQQQGPAHKKLVRTYIVDECAEYPTFSSLYRPVTKKGDPRIWINKVRGVSFLQPNDIFAIIVNEQVLYVVNLTRVNVPKVCDSLLETPLKCLINRISKDKNLASTELLGLIREKMTDWRPSEVMADTGIGRTIESLLGINMNASKLPDYKGIEIKSHRELAKVRNVLFTQTPDWRLSRFKSGHQIVERYGYISKDLKSKTLQVTLCSGKPNRQLLGLDLNESKGLLEAVEFSPMPADGGSYRVVNNIVTWTLHRLHERLLIKHHETFWVDVETRTQDGKEYFRCTKIEHTKNPITSQFDTLLGQGGITVDFLLDRPSGNGDTYSFKIKKSLRSLLFPESSLYVINNQM